MISYNTIWLENLHLLNAIEDDYNDGLIPENEFRVVKEARPVDFYTPNIFVRIGLFFLTLISASCASGFLSFMAAEAKFFEQWGWPLFLGLGHYLALELVIRARHHFRSGVDDALIWISGGLFALSFAMALNADDNPVLFAAFIFVISGALAIRFVDSLASLISYAALLALIFFSWEKIGAWGNATMPFLMMLVSATVYLIVRKALHSQLEKCYGLCFVILQLASLLSLYAAGNYLVVKELNDILNGTVSKSIPFGWLFWSWTISLPIIYIITGIRQRNSILLRTGLLLIAAATGTYKAYYQLMPLEYTLVSAGTLALAIAYVVSRYLHTPKNGFTVKELRKEYLMEELQIENMLIGETMADQAETAVNTGVEFGGGSFGGGGSSGGF